ncbi:MAG: efflux RND transporter periplasmic adaptor subunit [Planctomycetota bacterium]
MKRHIALVGLVGIGLLGTLPASAQPDRARRGNLFNGADLDAMTRFQSFDGIKCVTRPSRDSVLGFSLPTQIAEVAVAGGERVTQGQLLIRGDDEEDIALLETQRIRADTDLPVQRAVKQAALAETEWQSAQTAFQRGGMNQLEYDRARLAAETTQIDVGIAKNTLAQDRAQIVRFEARVRRLRLVAPFDGVVDNVVVDVGQSVSESDQVVRVVNIDPLWIDVPTPTAQTIELELAKGDAAWIAMDLPGEPRVVAGTIVEVSPVADAASGTRRIRVEAPNPEQIVAGVTAYVRFTEPTEAWRARIAARVPGGADAVEPVDASVREVVQGAPQ